MNSEFKKFLAMAGGYQEAADIAGCKESMIRHINKGIRGVSKGIARNIIKRYPELSLYALLYGDSDE